MYRSGSAFLLALLAFAASARVDEAAPASTTEAYAQLVLGQRYVEARVYAEARRRDDAVDGLTLLLDLAAEASREDYSSELDGWLADYRRAVEAKFGPRSKAAALPLALEADKAVRDNQLEEAVRLADEAVALLRDGGGDLPRAQASLVLAIAADAASTFRRYEDALQRARDARAAVMSPRDTLERLRFLRASYYYSDQEERIGEIDAAVDDARSAVAEAAKLGPAGLQFKLRLQAMLVKQLVVRGDYVEAQTLAHDALNLLSDRPSSRFHRAYLFTHLAEAEEHIGAREAALQHYDQAVVLMSEDPFLAKDPALGGILNNQARLESRLGRHEVATAHAQRALTVFEEGIGKDNVGMVDGLVVIGDVALAAGRTEEAEQHFRRALALVTTHLGEGHAQGAGSLAGLGRIALVRGELKHAQELLDAAIRQHDASYGSAVFAWRCALALAEARSGNVREAFGLAADVEESRLDLLRRLAPILPEAQGLELKRDQQGCPGLMLQLAAAEPDPARIRRAWGLVATARQFTTRLVAARLANARQAADAAGRERWQAWTRAAQRYAHALALRDEDLLGQAREALARAETGLGEAALREATPPRPQDPVESLQREAPGSTLVAFADGPGYAIAPAAREAEPGPARRYAFVARPDGTELHDIGGVDAIDADAEAWYRLASQPGLAGLDVRGAALVGRVVTPLGLRPGRVFVIAAGALNRVDFAALPDKDAYLVERGYRFHGLESEADLHLAALPVPAARVVLVGAPDFGPVAAALPASRGTCPPGTTAGLPGLAGARAEIDEIAAQWKVQPETSTLVLSGAAATPKAVLAAAGSADVLHFATHTVEVDGGCALRGKRGIVLLPKAVADPRTALERSAALALADANRGADGLLLAPAIATLDLGRTRWVVLSACDTGLGPDFGDEGVFGLRRAFRLAGARTVVMSLWKVDDHATAQWMMALYRARLAEHANTSEAVARAQLAVLAERRAAGQPIDPFYWAGFVAVGDWR